MHGPAPQVDSDGDAVALEVLISQLFEFLLTLVGSPRLLPLLRPMLPDLMYRPPGSVFAALQEAGSAVAATRHCSCSPGAGAFLCHRDWCPMHSLH